MRRGNEIERYRTSQFWIPPGSLRNVHPSFRLDLFALYLIRASLAAGRGSNQPAPTTGYGIRDTGRRAREMGADGLFFSPRTARPMLVVHLSKTSIHPKQ